MAVAELAAAIRTSAADFATTIVPVLTTLGWAPTATDVGKMSLELAFREALFAVMGQDDLTKDNFDRVAAVLDLSVQGLAAGFLNDGVMLLLQDLLECVTVSGCGLVFEYMDSRSDALLQNIAPNNRRGMTLLRMTNELLRRLSRTKHSVFAGKIRMLLARAFPICEQSGVNLNGAFNTDNVTVIDALEAQPEIDKMDTSSTGPDAEAGAIIAEGPAKPVEGPARPPTRVGSPAPLSTPVVESYDFYRQLWELQQWLSNPRSSLDTAATWPKAMTNVDVVLDAFENLPVVKQAQSSKKSKASAGATTDHTTANLPAMFIPKFLSSRKLLNLQLQDTQFLRHVLVQLLVNARFFELFTASQRAVMANIPNKAVAKLHTSGITLSDKQVQQLDRMRKRVLVLLRKLPPDGKAFTDMVLTVLDRDNSWVKWKNNLCQPFEKAPTEKDLFAPSKRTRVNIGDNGTLNLGNQELTRLFNIAPDTDAFVLDPQNHNVPLLATFLDRIKMELDPDSGIEKEYRMAGSAVWVWRCLRLVSRTYLEKLQNVTHTDGEDGIKLPNLDQFMRNLEAPPPAPTASSNSDDNNSSSSSSKRKTASTTDELDQADAGDEAAVHVSKQIKQDESTPVTRGDADAAETTHTQENGDSVPQMDS